MALLNEYLTKKLVYDNHPVMDESCCLNTIQTRNPCRICQDHCVYGVYDRSEPVWDRCLNCGICAAICPTGCISPSRFQSDKMITLLRSKKPSITLSCQHRTEEADLALPCLTAFPKEYLALLILDRQVSIIEPDCSDCPYKPAMGHFEDSLTFLRELLGEEVCEKSLCFAKGVSEDTVSKYTRREAFSHLFSRTRSTAGILLPEVASASLKLWRNLLSAQIVKHAMTVSWSYPTFTDSCNACGMCRKVCPDRAIYQVTEPGDPAHIHMAVLPEKCSSCGLCASLCPSQGINPPRPVKGISDPSVPVIHTISCRFCIRCGEPMAEDSPQELCDKCLGELRLPL